MGDITVLTANNEQLCKRFTVAEKYSYPSVTWFYGQTRPVSNIEQLSLLLSELENDSPNSCIVRGRLAEDVDLSRTLRRRIRRSKAEFPNERALLDDPCQWLMIDIDKLALPDALDVITDTREALQFALNQLPEELHNCSHHWQLSNSAGINDTKSISVHFYFWLDIPIANDVLKTRWALPFNDSYGSKLIDTALFNPAQIHYTAKPICEGITDPFAGRRSGFLKGDHDTVSLRFRDPIKVLANADHALTTMDGILPVGYENKLFLLGDAEGCLGFNDVIVAATASYASANGSKNTLAHIEPLKKDLRERILEADTTRHSQEEIDRYLSDNYLDSCINSAIAKFGEKNNAIPPHWDKELLSLDQGQQMLAKVIQDFGRAAKAFHEDPLGSNYPVYVIKATAGLGKTRAVIKDLLAYNLLEYGDVHYFVPSHRLSSELLRDLNDTLTLEIKDTDGANAAFERARIIYGRDGEPNSSDTYCRKNDLAKEVHLLGLNVMSTLCKSGTTKCEYYDDCPYIAQLDEPDAIPPEMIQVFSEVKVMTHEHLFLRAKERFLKPALTVIDESFVKNPNIELTLNITELQRIGEEFPVTQLIGEYAAKDKPHLLQALREQYSATDLRSEAEELSQESESAITSLRPDLSYAKQKQAAQKANQTSLIPDLLRTLADELSITQRQDSHAVSWDESKVYIVKRKELSVYPLSPILIIDADADKTILSKFLPNFTMVEIDVQRQAEVFQCHDLSFSKNSFNEEVDGSRLNQIKDFITRVAKGGRSTLVVCNKSIRKLITGDTDANDDSEVCGATITHFNNIRGLNKYSLYENVIIIGREQPSSSDVEKAAKGVFWDDEKLIITLSTKSGSRPLRQAKRGYRLSDGSYASVMTQLHPDYRVQAMVEQIRESESTQAIDRLRLLRPHPEGKQRKVFILSSVPLDITVNHLFSWKALQRSLALIEEADGFLPLNKKHLAERCTSVGSEATAKERITDLKRLKVLIDIVIREGNLYTADYKASGSNAKRYSEAWVSEGFDLSSLKPQLEITCKK